MLFKACFVINPRIIRVDKADNVTQNETLLDKKVTNGKNECVDWVYEI